MLGRYLTKREQQLVKRRRNAEELLAWNRRLDAEEREVAAIEQQALAKYRKDDRHQATTGKDDTNATSRRLDTLVVTLVDVTRPPKPSSQSCVPASRAPVAGSSPSTT